MLSKTKIENKSKVKATWSGNRLSFLDKFNEKNEFSEESHTNKKKSYSKKHNDISHSKKKFNEIERKETNSTKKQSNSLENNELNWDLLSSQLNRQFSQKSKTSIDSINSNLIKDDNFPYDNSILKQIDIEFVIENIEKVKDIQVFLDNIISKFKDFFSLHCFKYYEYSNPINKSNINYSHIDSIDYDHLYSTSGSIVSKAVIKDINYISAMTSLYRKISRGDVLNDNDERYNDSMYDDFFYLVTPLLSIYFFKYESTAFFKQYNAELDNSGAIISNYNKSTRKTLKDYGINYSILNLSESQRKTKTKLKKKLPSSIPLYSIPNMSSEVEIFSNFINATDETDTNHFDSLIYIKNYYQTLFFNMLINEYENSTLNVFAPYSFESSTYRECKFQIHGYKKDENKIVVNLKVFGCIFHVYLQLIMNFLIKAEFLSKEKKLNNKIEHNFSIKFHHFLKTSNFYVINKKLTGPVEKVHWKNKSFYIKTQFI